MDIYANKGDKVVYANPDNGGDHHRALAAKHLVLGETYTIERTEVHSYRTGVYLQEVPKVEFNSVLFKDKEGAVKNPPPVGEWRISRVENHYKQSVSGQPESVDHPNVTLGTVYEGAIEPYDGAELPVVGNILTMWVTSINGRRAEYGEGFFRSSTIQKIEGNLFYTKNSVYKVEKVKA